MHIQQQNIAQLNDQELIDQSEFFLGPVPHPKLLEQYGTIDSSFPNRMLTMAENEQKHNNELENTDIKIFSRNSLLGIIFLFVICIGLILSGTLVLIYTNKDVPGLFLCLSGVAPLIVQFIYNNKQNDKDKKNDNDNS